MKNYLHKKYLSQYLSPYIVLLFDVFVTFILFIIAYHILNNFNYKTLYPFLAERQSIILLSIYTISFTLFKSYRGIIRHTNIKDAFLIFKASFSAFIILFMLRFLIRDINNLNLFPPLSALVIHFMLVVIVLTTSRFLVRIIYSYIIDNSKELTTPVIIYGAGSAGLAVAKALMHDNYRKYKVVAFIDDNIQLNKMKVIGIPIYKRKKALSEKFIKKHNIQLLVIAIVNLNAKRKRKIVEKGLKLDIKVRIIPSLDKWIDGELNPNQLRDVKIEELLERDTIKLERENVSRDLRNKVILITGAAGSIGSEISRQVIQHRPKKVILIDQAETPIYSLQQEFKNNKKIPIKRSNIIYIIASVKDKARLEKIFSHFNPDIIYHAAAYKHVPLMEENPYEAITTNIIGTSNMADLAIRYNASKFVMISTDKAINPTNVMGATKRTAEILIQNIQNQNTQFITTRFGNVLGSNGSVVPIFKKQIEGGGPVTITDKKIIRYFMTIPEACNLVLEAGAMGKSGDIFVFDMGSQVKIYDLAKKMIKLAGFTPEEDIKIIETGLRPGEKLYEELLATEENTQPTYHPKIMIAQTRKVDFQEFDLLLNRLLESLHKVNNMGLVQILKEMIPEYISNNSVYASLDSVNVKKNAQQKLVTH